MGITVGVGVGVAVGDDVGVAVTLPQALSDTLDSKHLMPFTLSKSICSVPQVRWKQTSLTLDNLFSFRLHPAEAKFPEVILGQKKCEAFDLAPLSSLTQLLTMVAGQSPRFTGPGVVDGEQRAEDSMHEPCE